MSTMSDQNNELVQLHLSPRLTGAEVDDLHARLLDLSVDQKSLCIDASDLTLIDTTAIQILMAAAMEQKQRGLRFSVSRANDVLSQAMASLGLQGYLDNWSMSNG